MGDGATGDMQTERQSTQEMANPGVFDLLCSSLELKHILTSGLYPKLKIRLRSRLNSGLSQVLLLLTCIGSLLVRILERLARFG